jgi:hypothetical protein
MSGTTTQALAPTARALAWTPLLAATGVLLALASLLRALDAPSPVVVSLGVGVMAAAVVDALRDPAAALLAAVPVSLAVRRALRLGLAAAVAVPLWLLVGWVLPGRGLALAPLLALVAAGVAVATWLPDGRAVRLAAGVPLLWVVLSEVLAGFDGPVLTAARLWSDHPVVVAGTASLVVLLGRHR